MNFSKSLSQNFFHNFLLLSLCISAAFIFALPAGAQKRDNMTDEEDMKVRDAQEIDLRMEAYSKIINRRLAAIGNPSAVDSKESKKDFSNDWGALRTGTNAELFWDIQKTLDESISKIDDIAKRDQKNPLFGKAVHILADNCKEWIPKFRIFGEKASTDQERNAIVNSVNSCSEIVEASAKVSKEVPKEAKDKKKKTE